MMNRWGNTAFTKMQERGNETNRWIGRRDDRSVRRAVERSMNEKDKKKKKSPKEKKISFLLPVTLMRSTWWGGASLIWGFDLADREALISLFFWWLFCFTQPPGGSIPRTLSLQFDFAALVPLVHAEATDCFPIISPLKLTINLHI